MTQADDRPHPAARTPFDLSGRTALVTGAAGGLGFEIARALGRAGAKLIVHGRDPARIEAAADRLRVAGIDAGTMIADLGDEQALAAAIEALIARVGPIDILVNNAGGRDRRPIESLDRAALRDLFEINMVAPFDLVRRLAPHMAGGGRIINITSIAGPIARAGDAGYTGAKGGLAALTRALAAELGPRGITVNAVAPGYFATEANRAMVEDEDVAAYLARRTALGRWGQPAEIGGAVVFLASAEAAYVTGQTIAVDGGYMAHF